MVTAWRANLKATPLTREAALSSTFAEVHCHAVRRRKRRAAPYTVVNSPGQRVKRLIMGFLPPTVRAHAREMRRLSGRARRLHLTLAIRRWAFREASSIPASAGPGARVLFVCHGNIIRSALAEALLREHFARAGATVVVRSAGVAATPGRPADPRAISVARPLGVDLSEHRASLLSAALVDESDLIFIMDRLNEAEVLARFPAARGKLRRLGSLAVDSTDGDVIPDPFSLETDAVGAAAERIDNAVRALTASMLRNQPAASQ